jgi:hypothetical protein
MTSSLPLSPRPGLYRHFKGQHYQVLGVAKHCSTEETLVVYRCLYGDFDLWVRPVAEFCSDVEREGRRLPRFEWLGEGGK